MLSRRQGLRQEEASNLEAMAELYRDAGDVHRALDLYARAEPINRELGLVVEAGADLRSEAEIQGELGAMEKASAAAGEALARTGRPAHGSRSCRISSCWLISRPGRPMRPARRIGSPRRGRSPAPSECAGQSPSVAGGGADRGSRGGLAAGAPRLARRTG